MIATKHYLVGNHLATKDSSYIGNAIIVGVTNNIIMNEHF